MIELNSLNTKKDPNHSKGLAILCACLPFVGIVLYLVWFKSNKEKSYFAMKWALIGFVIIGFVYLIFMCIILIYQYNASIVIPLLK